jgi:hypothetical protein
VSRLAATARVLQRAGAGRVLSICIAFPVLILAAALTRLPFFIDYPFPLLWSDSAAYLYQAGELLGGRIPEVLRVPIYSLLITTIFSIPHADYYTLIGLQTGLYILSFIYFLFATIRLGWWLAPGVALVLAIYIGGHMALEANFSILGESLYTTIQVWVAAWALRYIESRRPIFLFLISLGLGVAVLTRAAGIFLIGFYLWGVLLLALSKARPHLSRFAFAFPLILAPLLIYNRLTMHVIALEPGLHRSSALSQVTAPFWQADPSYPPEINRFVERVVSLYSSDDVHALRTSWDPIQLQRIFAKRYDMAGAFSREVEAYKAAAAWQPGCAVDSLIAQRKLVQAINCHYAFYAQHVFLYKDAIKKSPVLYGKFVYSNMFNWWFGESRREYDFYKNSYLERQAVFYFERPAWLGADLLGYADYAAHLRAQQLPNIVLTSNPSGSPEIRFIPGWAYELYRRIYELRKPVYSSALWPSLYFMVLFAALFAFAFSGGRNAGAIIVFSFALLPLAASLVVSASSPILPRYSYATEWMMFTVVALSPLLWTSVPRRN